MDSGLATFGGAPESLSLRLSRRHAKIASCCAFLCRHRQGAPEDQAVAKRRDVAFGFDELDEPGTIADLAVENRAGETSVAHDELLVLAAAAVAQSDFLIAVVARLKHAGGKHIDAGDLQTRMGNRRDIRRRPVAA